VVHRSRTAGCVVDDWDALGTGSRRAAQSSSRCRGRDVRRARVWRGTLPPGDAGIQLAFGNLYLARRGALQKARQLTLIDGEPGC